MKITIWSKLKIAKCKDNHLPKTQTQANAGTVFRGGVSSGASAVHINRRRRPSSPEGKKGKRRVFKGGDRFSFKYMQLLTEA